MAYPDKETRPVSDPYAEDCGPYNPNIIGRLRKPPEDTASNLDYLAHSREWREDTGSATTYRQQRK